MGHGLLISQTHPILCHLNVSDGSFYAQTYTDSKVTQTEHINIFAMSQTSDTTVILSKNDFLYKDISTVIYKLHYNNV